MRFRSIRALFTALALLTVVAAGAVSKAAAATPQVTFPFATISPTSGAPGGIAVIKAHGFGANAAITIRFAGSMFNTGSDAAGDVFYVARVPAVQPAKLTITVRLDAIARHVSIQFTIVSKLAFGVVTPSGLASATDFAAVEAVVGEAPSMLLSYADFNTSAPISAIGVAASKGVVPVITWEPWQWGSTDQSAYSLASIAAGAHDAYIRSWANALAKSRQPVDLRFAHEMNGNWYPWAKSARNKPGDYVAAWRHTHDIFTAAKATNVLWVWSPNVPGPGFLSLDSLYPGRGYVDYVALDGYNWGASQTWSTWISPSRLFDAGIAALEALAPTKPMLIAETASSEYGGSKADWIAKLVPYLASKQKIVGFIWFDIDKETNWPLTSSRAAATAMRRALKARG